MRNAGKRWGCTVRCKWMQMWPGHVYKGRDVCTGAVMHGPGPGRVDWGRDMWIEAGTCGLKLRCVDWGWDAEIWRHDVWIGAVMHGLRPGCITAVTFIVTRGLGHR